MPPTTPLPLPDGFSDETTYVQSLLRLFTSSELIQRLCGGVHILDFMTAEPDLYSTVLPLSWREWFLGRDLSDILDLLMREDLRQFSPLRHNPSVTGLKGASDSLNSTSSGSWRGGTLPPDSLIDYIRDIRGHCLNRDYGPVAGDNGASPKSKPMETLSRRVTVGMKPKKVHEVQNFARYVHNLALDIAFHNDTEITHMIDFGSGQNYLGRALTSKPYSRNVVAIESKRHNIEGARSMDVTAQLVKKEKILRNKREYRSGRCEKTARADEANKEGSHPQETCMPEEPVLFRDRGVLATQESSPNIDGEHGKIQYLEHEIKNGDLCSVIERIKATNLTDSEISPTRQDDKQTLVPSWEKEDLDTKLMVISLHSCGNLLHHGLRSLILNPSVAAVALVGCCYNLVTERLGPPSDKRASLRLPNLRLDRTSSACDPDGFPMSDTLATYTHEHGEGIRLNITARMMAVQAPQNWTPTESDAFFTRHFYRALLQRVFLDQGIVSNSFTLDETLGGSPRGWSGAGQPLIIGSLRKACYTSFKTYVRGAVAKLANDPERGELITEKFKHVTDEELEAYEKRYISKRKELSTVWSLMAFSAGVVESVIVVDRWLFLKEQSQVRDCWVEAVFDYKQSPRNLVVVGVKR